MYDNDEDPEKDTLSSLIIMAIKKKIIDTEYRTNYEKKFGLYFNLPIPIRKLEERVKDTLGDLILDLGFSPSYANDFYFTYEEIPPKLKYLDNYYLMAYTVICKDEFEAYEDKFFKNFLDKYGEFTSLLFDREIAGASDYQEPIFLVNDDLILLECGFNYPM